MVAILQRPGREETEPSLPHEARSGGGAALIAKAALSDAKLHPSQTSESRQLGGAVLIAKAALSDAALHPPQTSEARPLGGAVLIAKAALSDIAKMVVGVEANESLLQKRAIVSDYSLVMGFIRTTSEPTIFYLPAKHNEETERLLRLTRTVLERKVALMEEKQTEHLDIRAPDSPAARPPVTLRAAPTRPPVTLKAPRGASSPKSRNWVSSPTFNQTVGKRGLVLLVPRQEGQRKSPSRSHCSSHCSRSPSLDMWSRWAQGLLPDYAAAESRSVAGSGSEGSSVSSDDTSGTVRNWSKKRKRG